FDAAHADVVLRSSNGKDFPMYKLDLPRLSPVFEAMFTLPQPSENTTSHEASQALPVVQLTESSQVLQVLLRFYLPGPPPSLTDFPTAVRVLEGARKYEIDFAADATYKALQETTEDEPIRVYAIACHYSLEPLGRKAA
ncbi:uncharacterized protein PHACADRAFT_53674, partial [Phanerochaete carnosa HHB-10118-sp]